MITREDVQALAVVLQRTPMTLPERLWVSGLLDRLSAVAEAAEQLEHEEVGDAVQARADENADGDS